MLRTRLRHVGGPQDLLGPRAVSCGLALSLGGVDGQMASGRDGGYTICGSETGVHLEPVIGGTAPVTVAVQTSVPVLLSMP